MGNEIVGYITRLQGKSSHQEYGLFPVGSTEMLAKIEAAEEAIFEAENLVYTLEEQTKELEERTEELVTEAESAVESIKVISMQKPYTINVIGADCTSVLVGYEYGVNMKITKISTINIAQLHYNILNGAYGDITLTGGVWEGEIDVPDGSKLYWTFDYVDSTKQGSIIVKQEQKTTNE